MTATMRGTAAMQDRLEITLVPAPAADDGRRQAALAEPGFGRVFTDHMVTASWTTDSGWHDARLSAYEPLVLDPAAMVLHYGQAVFEGLKAYRQADGGVALFRPLDNAARLRRSAVRLAMPEVPDSLFLDSVEALVRQDRAWVPDTPEHSLYLRPLLIATEAGLGVRPANEYRFILFACPAGSFFPRGVEPVTVWLSTQYTRAAQGGTGEAKCSGNYAGSLEAQRQAADQGCDQVVWLDAVEHRFVEEMGGMNLCFVLGSGPAATVVTPPLTGTLLPGITRDSLLRLAADLGYAVAERPVSTHEWRDGCASGAVSEVFACGTAAVITPVGHVQSAEGNWTVGDGGPGPASMRLRAAMLDLQTGRVPDPYGWRHPV